MSKQLPIIGILGEISPPSPSSVFQNFKRQGCVDSYTSIFETLNTPSILLPELKNYNDDIISRFISNIDGLLIPGGADVSPSLYNEQKKEVCGNTYLEKDIYAIKLIKEAFKQKKPILGICRGAQLLNVAFSGSLFQDQKLSNRENHDFNHMDLNNIETISHQVIINKDSQLFNIFYKQILETNSLHHQSINKIAENFKISAISFDGLIEAIELDNPNYFVLGIQWHPETLFAKSDDMKPLFEAFIKAL